MKETILWRILGNDIPDRHSPTQTADCLKWILERESIFPYCTKRFLLNRIVDAKKNATLKDMLMDYGADFTEIPFVPQEYAKLEPNDRGSYLTNQAGAKNFCIEWGFENEFDFVMPYNGQIFIRDDGWEGWQQRTHEDYGTHNSDKAAFLAHLVFRVEGNEVTSDASNDPAYGESWKDVRSGMDIFVPQSEPQIAFGHNSDIRYREQPYGYSHVDLLCRLGVHGIWDRIDPDRTRESVENKSKYFQKIVGAGFCFRLESGNPEADRDGYIRIAARQSGLCKLVESTNESYVGVEI